MELFKAKLGSPVTQLADNITNTQTTISLINADVLPDAPNIATIGTGVNAETIKYSGKTLNTLTGVTRGFSGTAKAWASGQTIARIFTQYDWDSSVDNVQSLEGGTIGQVLTKASADDYDFVWGAGGGGGGGSATDITYDNTTSGLTATDVQAAIDEIDAAVDTNTSNISTNTSDIATLTTTKLSNIVEDLTPELGGELDAGEHTIGFADKVNTSATGAVTIDFTTSNKQNITLTENTTATFTNPSNPCNVQLLVKQDATGSWTLTLPTILWVGGSAPTLTTTANAIDIISLYFDGTNYFGMAGLNFS